MVTEELLRFNEQDLDGSAEEMKVLDLFSGLGGFSQAFVERGHEVITYDIEPRFNPTFVVDIFALSILPKADVVLASPPCEKFSMMQIGKNWTREHQPKTEGAKTALELVRHTLKIIPTAESKFWILENPRAKLRKLIGTPTTTISWCKYGSDRMKPTDLWGNLPPSFVPLMCKNGTTDHIPSPRGSRTGTQSSRPSEELAKIPHGLSLALCLAMEKDLQ